MRRTMLVGGALAVATFLVVLLSSALDLELESVALVGVGLGAVVALVPDRTPWTRLAGFAAGVVVAWIVFILRAAMIPDTATGRALALTLVVLLCTGVAAASASRIALWSVLLGAAAMSGAYEYVYAAAPPEVASTSVTAVTALLLTVAVGYLVVGLTGLDPVGARPARRPETSPAGAQNDATALDDLMEKTK
jgi:hypothetical protein